MKGAAKEVVRVCIFRKDRGSLEFLLIQAGLHLQCVSFLHPFLGQSEHPTASNAQPDPRALQRSKKACTRHPMR